MANEMDEIINEFIIEAEEILEKLDPLFVQLEQKGHDIEIVNEIFRGMHTLKGAAGFLGFQSIVDVAHKAETILKKIREGEFTLTSKITDAILKATDTIRILISQIKAKEETTEDISPVLNLLDNVLIEALKKKEDFEQKEKLPPVKPEEEPKPTRPEEVVTQIPKEKEVSTLRVDVERIDKVMDLAG
ncbi:MAG: Hpt domain-containing protein [Thermodesulfovibrionaceae bacterium]